MSKEYTPEQLAILHKLTAWKYKPTPEGLITLEEYEKLDAFLKGYAFELQEDDVNSPLSPSRKVRAIEFEDGRQQARNERMELQDPSEADHESFKRMKASRPITPADALFGFGSWLTTRDEAVTFSAKHNANVMVDLLKEYFDLVGIPSDVSPGYPENIDPKYKSLRNG